MVLKRQKKFKQLEGIASVKPKNETNVLLGKNVNENMKSRI